MSFGKFNELNTAALRSTVSHWALLAAGLAVCAIVAPAQADTTIVSGTSYTVSAGNSLPDSGQVTVLAGGALRADGGSGPFAFGNTLSLTGDGVLVPPGLGALYVPSSTNQVTSTGSVFVAPNAVIGSDGLINFTGQISQIGAPTPASIVEIRGAGGVQFSGPVTGTLGILKSGTGTLTLAGANTTTGAIQVQNGTLALRTASPTSGSITVASCATLALQGTGMTMAGVSSITLNNSINTVRGSLYNESGDNTIASSILFNDGARINSDATGRGLLINSNLAPIVATPGVAETLTFGGTGNTVVTGTISNGTGKGPIVLPTTVTKDGVGTLTLSGANTYSGGTVLAGGTTRISSDANLGASTGTVSLRGGSLALGGNVTSARGVTLQNTITGGIVMDAGTASTLSGPITGSGVLNISGPGTLTLAGTNTSTAGPANPGGTAFSGGTLILANANATGVGTFAVNAGLVRTDNVNHLINTSVYTQAAPATLQLRQMSATTAERVAVSGAATLNGTLQVLPGTGYTIKSGDTYVVLTGASLSGQFSRVVLPIGYVARTTYGTVAANQVGVTVQNVSLPDLAINANAREAANAIMRGVGANLTGDFQAMPNAFIGLPADATTARYLNDLTPQRFQIFRNIAFDQASFLNSQLESWRGEEGFRGAGTLAERDTGHWTGFVSANGIFGDVDATVDTEAAKYSSAGLVAGAAYAATDMIDVGVLIGYQSAHARLDYEGSRGSVSSISPGIFANYTNGGLDLRALFAYSFNSYDTDRHVLLGSAFDRMAHGETKGNSPTVSLGMGYDFGEGAIRLGPMFNATHTHLSINAFTEGNAGSASLNVGRQSSNSLRTQLGGHIAVVDGFLADIHPEVNAGWQRESKAGASNLSSDFVQVGTGGFNTSLTSLIGNAFFADVTFSGRVANHTSVFLGYHLQNGTRATAQSVMADIKISF